MRGIQDELAAILLGLIGALAGGGGGGAGLGQLDVLRVDAKHRASVPAPGYPYTLKDVQNHRAEHDSHQHEQQRDPDALQAEIDVGRELSVIVKGPDAKVVAMSEQKGS